MKVKEIMVKDVVNLKSDDNARDALDLIIKMEISGLPVIDADGKLVGMFTEKEVISYILPSYIDKVGAFVYEENPKSIQKKISELGKIKVSQLMRKEVVTVNEEANLGEVSKVMLTKKARRIPVMDKSGKVAGIVARCDVLKSLLKEAQSPTS